MNQTEKRKAEEFVNQHIGKVASALAQITTAKQDAYSRQPLPKNVQKALDTIRLAIIEINGAGFQFQYDTYRNTCPPEDAAKVSWPQGGREKIQNERRNLSDAVYARQRELIGKVWDNGFSSMTDLFTELDQIPIPDVAAETAK